MNLSIDPICKKFFLDILDLSESGKAITGRILVVGEFAAVFQVTCSNVGIPTCYTVTKKINTNSFIQNLFTKYFTDPPTATGLCMWDKSHGFIIFLFLITKGLHKSRDAR